MHLGSRTVAAVLLLLAQAAGCGDAADMTSSADSDILGPGGALPFGGQAIKFHSTYAYFPSDFSLAVVRDTMPQEDACRLLKMYASSKPPLSGLPVLPYEQEHYALVINVDSVQNGDEISLDPTDRGGVADMRYAVLGQFAIGKNATPIRHWPATGAVRIAELMQYKRARGDFRLEFAGGEHIEQPFDVTSCQ